MPEAARVADPTTHGTPLAPGIGSLTVLIGGKPAWRAVAPSLGAALDSVSNTMKSFMQTPVLTPANATSKLAEISQGLTEAGAQAAAAGNPGAAGAAGGALATLNATNVTLTSAWTTASAAPGGQPAANTAYTEGIKAAAAGAASAVFSSIGAMFDMHICPMPCPVPPHGPGMVTKGSDTVFINSFAAARKGDKVMEACGGSDPISMGDPTVMIGDSGGGGGGSGGGSGAAGAGGSHEAGVAGDVTALRYGKETAPGECAPSSLIPCTIECANTGCAEAFAEAAETGAPLVDRDSYGCSGPCVDCVDTGTHWIEIELVGEDDLAIRGEPYTIRLPDGTQRSGVLDGDGQARLEGITQTGECQVSFTRLDGAAWQRDTGASAGDDAPPSAPPGGAVAATQSGNVHCSGGAGGRVHRVAQGECISSIAVATGHFWSTIWDHAANSALRDSRGEPNVLLAGDEVFVPDAQPKEEPAAIDEHHRFRRLGEPSMIRLRVLDGDTPRANVPYTLEIDQEYFSGTTDENGCIDQRIPGNARGGRLTVGEGDERLEYMLELGCLDPVTEHKGVQARLYNLGYYLGEIDGELNEATQDALAQFQEAQGLTQTGAPDDATRQKLVDAHGS